MTDYSLILTSTIARIAMQRLPLFYLLSDYVGGRSPDEAVEVQQTTSERSLRPQCCHGE